MIKYYCSMCKKEIKEKEAVNILTVSRTNWEYGRGSYIDDSISPTELCENCVKEIRELLE